MKTRIRLAETYSSSQCCTSERASAFRPPGLAPGVGSVRALYERPWDPVCCEQIEGRRPIGS